MEKNGHCGGLLVTMCTLQPQRQLVLFQCLLSAHTDNYLTKMVRILLKKSKK